MKPISPVLNCGRAKILEIIFAAAQPEYLPLPALRSKTGRVTTRWKLSWRERFKIFFTGNLWLQQLTFNTSLQPQLPTINEPTLGEAIDS